MLAQGCPKTDVRSIARIVARVAASLVMRDEGVGSWIERRARIAPDQPALIHGEWRCTYGELANRVRRLAHGFRELGVRRGDRVGWLGANHPAFLEVLFATSEARRRHRTGQSSARPRRHQRCAAGILAHGRGGGADRGRRCAPAGRRVPCGRRCGDGRGRRLRAARHASPPTIPSTRSSDSTMCACSRTRRGLRGHRKG